MTNKDYRLNRDGTVSTCASNIVRMNVAEVLYYSRRRIANEVGDIVGELRELIAPVVALLLAPVAFPAMAYFQIRMAKKEVAREEARGKK